MSGPQVNLMIFGFFATLRITAWMAFWGYGFAPQIPAFECPVGQ